MSYRIVQLEAQNVMRLVAVRITPEGNLVVVGGRNAQGKTSVLDSIQMALAGKSAQPAKPVRAGAGKGEITCEIADPGDPSASPLKVARVIQASGSSALKVTGPDGRSYSKPQALLDELAARIGFDPLAFVRASAKEQGETLRNLVGLDFTALDAERDSTYENRTEVNREVKRQEARLSAQRYSPGAPAEPIEVEDLFAELEAATASQESHAKAHHAVDRCRDDVERCRARADATLKRIADLKGQLASAERDATSEAGLLQMAEDALAKCQASAAQVPEPSPVSPIQAKIRNSKDLNEAVRKNAEYRATQQAVQAEQAKADRLTKHLEDLAAQKAKAIAEADYPVAGLSVSPEGDVLFNGLPFSQASQAEKLRVSTAVALALNPKMPVVLIRDGSLLDDDNLALLAQMAEEADAQVWIERVGDGAECSVVIEDGEVRE